MAKNIVKLDVNIDYEKLNNEQKLEIVRNITKNIFKNADSRYFEIYPLKLDYINVVQHFIAKVKLEEDMLIPVSCYNNPFISVDNFAKINGVSVAKNLYFQNMDSEKYNDIYSKANDIITALTNTMKAMPSDLDRIIYANEYLVANTTYSKTSYGSARGGCLLALRYGMCSGFADAMNLLMHFSGVNSMEVSAPKMNHAWNYIEVDGELYHTDVCWNNTRSKSDKLQHRFLLLSDTAIKKVKPTHYSFSVYANDKAYGNEQLPQYKATSTRFDNWYVHNVKGRMYYHNGLWYYYDDVNNSIMSNNAQGSIEKIYLHSDSEKLTLLGIENGFIRFKINDSTLNIKL